MTTDVLEIASDLWATATVSGRSTDDADLIIAATAFSEGLVQATANTGHFTWIPNLNLANWRLT